MKSSLPLILALLLTSSTAGATTLISESWESGWGSWGHKYGGADIVSDTTAPHSSNSLRINIDYDMVGNSPEIIGKEFSAQDEIWVQFYIKFSSNYQWPSIHDKLVFLTTPSNNFYIGLMWGNSFGLGSQISWGPGSQNWNQSGGPSIKQNTWYKVVFHGVANTPGRADGIGQLWINDQLAINASNVPYRNVGESCFNKILLENVFGGPAGARSGFPKYTWYDSVIVQTTPISGGAIPPPSPSLSPKIPVPPSTVVIN